MTGCPACARTTCTPCGRRSAATATRWTPSSSGWARPRTRRSAATPPSPGPGPWATTRTRWPCSAGCGCCSEPSRRRAGGRAARAGRAAARGGGPRPRRRDGPGGGRRPALRQRRRRQRLGGLRPHARPRHRRHADPARLRARRLLGLDDAGPADRPPTGRPGPRPRHRLRRAEPAPGPARGLGDRDRPQPAGAGAGPADRRRSTGSTSTCARAACTSRSPGRRFDLVITNPPYVMSPPRGDADRLTYREGSCDRRRPGRAGGPRRRRPPVAEAAPCRCWPTGRTSAARTGPSGSAAGSAGSGCDAHVVQREVLDPHEYVELWLADAGPGRLAGLPAALRRLARLLRRPRHRGASGWAGCCSHRTGRDGAARPDRGLAVRRRAADRPRRWSASWPPSTSSGR